VRAKKIAALPAAAAILIALAVPAGALGAKSHRVRQKASVSTELHLRGTHGFRLYLSTFNSHSVILSAARQTSKFGETTVNYFALHGPARPFDGARLNVRVGKLGHFRGRFVPTSTEKGKLPLGCEGGPTRSEKGFFVGSFDFRGERGYTTVRSHRVRGSVTRQAAQVCTFPDEEPWHESPSEAKEEKERERSEFRLVAANKGSKVLFEASHEGAQKETDAPAIFLASVNGRKTGDFWVSYSAFVFDLERDDESSFLAPNLTEPLAEATLAPPAPFSGSATFHLESPKTASWTGDLAVELPGLGKVPLTGHGIDAGLCNGRSHCTETLPKDLVPLLETGGGDQSGFVSVTAEL
jgi:hypothetical protein